MKNSKCQNNSTWFSNEKLLNMIVIKKYNPILVTLGKDLQGMEECQYDYV